MSNSNPSLKSLNVKWLVMLVTFDIAVVMAFLIPEALSAATLSQITVMRLIVTAALPVVILLLTGILSHDQKAVLVYWRLKDVMPASRAFDKLGPKDSRVDMVSLKKNIGVLPVEPSVQNTEWFRLYQMVRNDPAVVEAHRLYLLYRDMAALSLPMIVLAPLAVYFSGASPSAAFATFGLFLLQFLMTATGARNSGERFVCNVLAIHASKKVVPLGA